MTREEAIEILADKVKPCLSGTDWNDAIDMAIKALEQEPTDENLHREREQAYMQGYEDASKRFRQEPCDDAISRQAVLDLINADWKYENLEIEIDNLPSVTPQEPRKSRDMKEIEEVINCDADAETKCKMISNILTAKPHYFEEPQEREEV